MIKNILFDLDGTLLPMDQNVFIDAYMRTLAANLAPHGYDPQLLVKGIWAGTAAMVQNDGSKTNEQAFWDCFASLMGEHVCRDEPLFDTYYRTDFSLVQKACGFAAESKALIDKLKRIGCRLILATNPIFPPIATQMRIGWAGLSTTDFEWITTYDNSSFCKPNPKYYREIFEKLGLIAEECLMIGNDVTEDMVAQSLGCKVFLLTNDLINKQNKDISIYPHGGFAELLNYIETELN